MAYAEFQVSAETGKKLKIDARIPAHSVSESPLFGNEQRRGGGSRGDGFSLWLGCFVGRIELAAKAKANDQDSHDHSVNDERANTFFLKKL